VVIVVNHVVTHVVTHVALLLVVTHVALLLVAIHVVIHVAIHVAVLHVAQHAQHLAVMIAAVVTFVPSHASVKEHAPNLKHKIFTKPAIAMKPHLIHKIIVLTNAPINHVELTVKMVVEMGTKQRNSILTGKLLFVKAHAMTTAKIAKHAEKEAHNAQKHVLILVQAMNAAHALAHAHALHATHAVVAHVVVTHAVTVVVDFQELLELMEPLVQVPQWL